MSDLLTMRDGDVRVEVLPELGGRIYRLTYGGVDLLRTPRQISVALADPFAWSSFVMAPWCNRIPGGVLASADRQIRLPANFHDGSAIHGEVHARQWRVTGEHALQVHGGQFGFPWRYSVHATVHAHDQTLHYRLTLRNEDASPMPAGLGWHPWFVTDHGQLTTQAPARLIYDEDPEHLPVGEPHPLRGEGFDPAHGGRVPPGTHQLLTDLHPHEVTLHWPRKSITARLAFSAAADHLLLYAAAELDALAVEPQTHATDGHRRALAQQRGAITVLAPGEELTVAYALTITAQHPTDTIADRTEQESP